MKLDTRQEDQDGQANATELSDTVYEELRRLAALRLAQESEAHTLQPTALVHEAWLKIAGSGQQFQDQAHFFRVAAGAMRRILIDHARRRQRAKRGGGAEREPLDESTIAITVPSEELLAVHDALEILATQEPETAAVVEMRYFMGMTLPEVARILGKSPRTVDRHWDFARAWLRREIKAAMNHGSGRSGDSRPIH